jgi:ferredoxin
MEASMQEDATKPKSTSVVPVTLDKPLGFILTEVQEDKPDGILISEVNPNGSAYSSPFKDQLVGSKIVSVNNINVERMKFDDVMELIASSESPVRLMVLPAESSSDSTPTTTTTTPVPTKVELPVGTVVSLTVTLAGESKSTTTIDAIVGDNLRKTLLDNNIELYRGWKKKLGNCGGGGQCTFCAVDVIDTSNSWESRSDYEETKIGRKMSSNGRLACMNNIQGPANIIIPS